MIARIYDDLALSGEFIEFLHKADFYRKYVL